MEELFLLRSHHQKEREKESVPLGWERSQSPLVTGFEAATGQDGSVLLLMISFQALGGGSV